MPSTHGPKPVVASLVSAPSSPTASLASCCMAARMKKKPIIRNTTPRAASPQRPARLPQSRCSGDIEPVFHLREKLCS